MRPVCIYCPHPRARLYTLNGTVDAINQTNRFPRDLGMTDESFEWVEGTRTRGKDDVAENSRSRSSECPSVRVVTIQSLRRPMGGDGARLEPAALRTI